ncbi:hypothetical protein D6779_05075 [Candidatus Parcubacteria bacterium]|nr:MAG: hypothetical protein D6779_05075 [Candidatus Parcubacteria bacterium]
MPSRYNIAFFVCQDGECPVQSYIFDGANETDLLVLIGVIQRLAHVGQLLIETNMAKKLQGHKPICELRKGRHRIFYAYDKQLNRFVMLSAFLKSTQKTPASEIRQAEKYWREYLVYKKVLEFDIPLDFDLAHL